MRPNHPDLRAPDGRYLLVSAIGVVLAAGCTTPTAIAPTAPDLVLDDAPFALHATVRDQRGDSMDEVVTWQTADDALVVDGDVGRCVAVGDVTVTATSGQLSAGVTVRCRPGAAIVAPARLRTPVGREILLVPTVEVAGEPIDVRVEVTSDGPAVVVADGQIRAAEAGHAVLTVRAATLSTTIAVDVVVPFSRERTYVVVSGPGGPALVSVGRSGDVTRERALPGLDPKSHVLLDVEGARVAWMRSEGGALVMDPGGGHVVLGDATPNTAIGLVDGLWAWTGADGAVRLEDGTVVEVPDGARFVGSDAGGRSCVVEVGRPRTYDDALSCLRPTGWQDQPPPERFYARVFGGLVDGGTAVQWHGNFKYDCGLGSCARILPVEAVGSGWPVAGVGVTRSVFGGGRAVEFPGADEFTWAAVDRFGDPSHTPAPPVDPGGPLSVLPRTGERLAEPPPDLFGWSLVALSPDGTLLLAGRVDASRHRVLQTSDVAARAAGEARTPLVGVLVSEPLVDPRGVDWRDARERQR